VTLKTAESLTWQDVECGAYDADLALWGELAAHSRGPILELGSGVGRVCLHLARLGHEVWGLDVDGESTSELTARAQHAGLPVTAIAGDARSLRLGRALDLVLAPMQFLNVVGGPRDRRAVLSAVRDCLEPGGRLAAAILSEPPPVAAGVRPLPDVREAHGWIYSSLPVAVVTTGSQVEVRRIRQLVSPAGVLSEDEHSDILHMVDADTLEAEARRAGFTALGRRSLPATEDHVGSTVLLLEGA
jgi:SAM-dependent methyltransferase